jgi:DNA-binding MarR family transcriptional regulator
MTMHRMAAGAFARLRTLRSFERRCLAFLKTKEDFDLVQEIGYHEDLGTPLTLKQVFQLGIASVATVQRRLKRLKDHGYVRNSRSTTDRRTVELTVSPKLRRIYDQYAALLARGGNNRHG